jgi:pimeloyl-ACP methyl ester carboxylesterase
LSFCFRTLNNRAVQISEHRLPGLVLRSHVFSLPVDHAESGGERIDVFAREAAAPDGLDRPWLVFFQGGPGHEASRPTAADSPVWLERALEDFRVLLLDQRGTGLSSPATQETLAGLAPEEQAAYLKHFRADSIVRDAEAIRAELGSPPWSALGQSFGGFCITTYLSLAPEGLREALITGGLPPLDRGPDDVYRATYRRVLDKNRAYYDRYPEDRDRVRELLARIRAGEVRLPEGDLLSVRRFRQLGNGLGMSDGAEELHYLLERPVGYRSLRSLESELAYASDPLYAVLHEACYAQGEATRWSADRVLGEFPEFEDETLFFGEMIYPWQFDEEAALRPLRDAAHLLAADDGWPPLYDAARLRENEVPVAAAVYANDMYVAREFSEETARTIRGAQVWLTSEYEHNGLRADGKRILGRLLDLVRGT